MSERWSEACDEFESIISELPDPTSNARRYFNYSLALTMTGRGAESLRVLESEGVSEWTPSLRGKGEELLRHLREGDVPPPDIT
jgi:hypothetical protein